MNRFSDAVRLLQQKLSGLRVLTTNTDNINPQDLPNPLATQDNTTQYETAAHAGNSTIPTGWPAFDTLIGGWPVGRVVEIFGPPASGKTTLAFYALAAAQKWAKQNGQEGTVAFIDAERTFDTSHATLCGVDVDKMLLMRPSCAEDAFATVEYLATQKAVCMVVIDSVAALLPKSEQQEDWHHHHNDDEDIDIQKKNAHNVSLAKIMSTVLRKLVGILDDNQVSLVLLNQMRYHVFAEDPLAGKSQQQIHTPTSNKAASSKTSNPENAANLSNTKPTVTPYLTTPGGQSLHFYASLRLALHHFDLEKIWLHVDKNKKIKRIPKTASGTRENPFVLSIAERHTDEKTDALMPDA